jgi:uncharacterized protein YraI
MVGPKAILAAIALLVLSAGNSGAETAVAETRLNLRSGPGPAFSVIVVMEPGTKVDVQQCHRTWCRVKLGQRTGFTSRAYLRFGTDAYASAVDEVAPPPAAAASAPASTGPRIWRWRDPDWRDRHWRKFGWRNRHDAQ